MCSGCKFCLFLRYGYWILTVWYLLGWFFFCVYYNKTLFIFFIANFDIFTFLIEWYCQYQRTDCDTEHFLSVWHYSQYDNNGSFEGLGIHHHYYRTRCLPNDPVCLDLQSCRCFIFPSIYGAFFISTDIRVLALKLFQPYFD